MATVTVTISLRREGRGASVDVEELAEAVVDAVAGGLDTIDLWDSAGEEVTYEVTRVRRLADQQQPATENDSDTTTPCEQCQTPVTQTPGARMRLYCSDACRQAAWRARQRS